MRKICQSGHRQYYSGDKEEYLNVDHSKLEMYRSCEYEPNLYRAFSRGKLWVNPKDPYVIYYLCRQCDFPCTCDFNIHKWDIPSELYRDLVNQKKWE